MVRAVSARASSTRVNGVRASKGDNWLDDYIPYLLFRISNRLDLKLRERLRKLKISIWWWRVLAVLRAYGTMTIGQIAETTAVEQPTVSRVVRNMESKGWATRETGHHDSRYVHVSLTARGQEAFDAILPAALRHQGQALDGISAQERIALKRALEAMLRNVEDGH
jgi:DNA-binding MarR family transcriptional regulator